MVGLMSLAALNMSQATVLCLGADGHIAVEPAGHSHCAGGSHTHHHDPAGGETDDHSHVGPDSCRPCVDLPFADEAGDVCRRPRSAPTPTAASALAIQTADHLDPMASVSSLWLAQFACCSSFLRSTILQV